VLQHRVFLNQRARNKVLTSLPPGRVRAHSVFASGYIWEIAAAIAQSVYNISSHSCEIIQGRHNLPKSHCERKVEFLELSLCSRRFHSLR
jgi:hypothetical protein